MPAMLAKLAALAGLSALVACSGVNKDTNPSPSDGLAYASLRAPNCDELVGKPLPDSVRQYGCKVGNTLHGPAVYTCKDGSTVTAIPGRQNETYYWAHAAEPVKDGTWDRGNAAATTC